MHHSDGGSSLHHANAREYHHFFPKDYLASKGFPARRINALANFVMLTAASNKRITNRAPSDYLKEVEEKLGDNLQDALSANLISNAAYAAAKQDDYDTFLKERAATIYQRAKVLTGW